MPQVSKYPISRRIEERIFEIFSKMISDQSQPHKINRFFEVFLSPIERMMLAKRLSIAVLLLKGYKYPDIRKVLRVSPPTIAGVSISLKYANSEFRSVIENLISDEKMEEFWNHLLEVIGDHVPPAGRNWSYWRAERERQKRTRTKAF